MAQVANVSEQDLQAGIGVCDLAIEELKRSAIELRAQYVQAGSNGWRDEKYQRLGAIVEECIGALGQPARGILECRQRLEALLREVQSYDALNI